MRQSGGEGSLGENGYMCMCGWVPSLFTWNYHHIVNQLYLNRKLKVFYTNQNRPIPLSQRIHSCLQYWVTSSLKMTAREWCGPSVSFLACCLAHSLTWTSTQSLKILLLRLKSFYRWKFWNQRTWWKGSPWPSGM